MVQTKTNLKTWKWSIKYFGALKAISMKMGIRSVSWLRQIIQRLENRLIKFVKCWDRLILYQQDVDTSGNKKPGPTGSGIDPEHQRGHGGQTYQSPYPRPHTIDTWSQGSATISPFLVKICQMSLFLGFPDYK